MKKQYTKQEIAIILNKFMAGETNLEEENVLAQYFRTHEVSDEWKEYKEMFALFDGGAVDIEQEAKQTAKPKTVPLRWVMTGIAASIILLIGFSALMKDERPTKQQPVVAETIEQSTPQPVVSEPIVEEKQEDALPEVQPTPQPAKKRRKAVKRQSTPIEEPLLAEAEPKTEEPMPEGTKVESRQEEAEQKTVRQPQEKDPFLLAATHAKDIRSRGERLHQEVKEEIALLTNMNKL